MKTKQRKKVRKPRELWASCENNYNKVNCFLCENNLGGEPTWDVSIYTSCASLPAKQKIRELKKIRAWLDKVIEYLESL